MKEKVKEAREWVNLAVTIVGPMVIAWLLWSMNSRLQVERLEIQKESDSKYQTLSDADRFQTLTNNKLDKLADGMSAVRDDVATIKGQLARRTQ